MGLDTLVLETVGRAAEAGHDVGPVAAKATVQVARFVIELDGSLAGGGLIAEVQAQLRRRFVLLTRAQVEAVLVAYTRLVVELEIEEVNELGW